MAKKNVTYVDQSKFEQLAAEAGLAWVPQKGFNKVSGAAGRNLYVANTKRVGRVDISGFRFEGEGVTDLGGEAFCSVSQQVDFSRTEEQILETFRAVMAHMATLPAREKEGRKQMEPRRPRGFQVPAPTDDALAARRALIERVAREKGAAIHPDTEARLCADLAPAEEACEEAAPLAEVDIAELVTVQTSDALLG